MKKYELVAEYPGSPKLGSIIQDTNPNNGAKDSWFSEDWGKQGKLAFKLGINLQPEKYPEFWKEIEEKNYEILTMKGSMEEGGNLYKVNDDGTVNPWGNPMKSVEGALNSGYTIHSIKRTSDGEIFTIGDLVMLDASWKSGDTYISKITLDKDDKIVFEIRQEKYNSSYPKAHLDEWTKINTILFRTEDGVDIRKGDRYFVIENVLLIPHVSRNNIKEFSCDDSGRHLNFINKPYFKIFSTKEAAEEYLIMNKPCLSLKEVLESYKFFHVAGQYLNQTATLIALRKLIKEKI